MSATRWASTTRPNYNLEAGIRQRAGRGGAFSTRQGHYIGPVEEQAVEWNLLGGRIAWRSGQPRRVTASLGHTTVLLVGYRWEAIVEVERSPRIGYGRWRANVVWVYGEEDPEIHRGARDASLEAGARAFPGRPTRWNCLQRSSAERRYLKVPAARTVPFASIAICADRAGGCTPLLLPESGGAETPQEDGMG